MPSNDLGAIGVMERRAIASPSAKRKEACFGFGSAFIGYRTLTLFA
jgi:hypothetical protein